MCECVHDRVCEWLVDVCVLCVCVHELSACA